MRLAIECGARPRLVVWARMRSSLILGTSDEQGAVCSALGRRVRPHGALRSSQVPPGGGQLLRVQCRTESAVRSAGS